MNESEIELIDFLEINDILEQLKEHAKKEHPDKVFVPFWRLILSGNKLIIRATVSNGQVGFQESVELCREIEG